MIELDGSFGEGGGQILRTSLALSLLTGKPFHLRNVRARRSRPGLQPQHLMSVKAAAQVGQATMKGASLHSTDLVFEPGPVTPGNYHFRIGTAGATGLVLHTVYLPLALSGGPSTVTVEGGTHVDHSPCFHFLERTWRRYLDLLGLPIRLEMRRSGFYPRGGGLIQANIPPAASLRALKVSDPPPVDRVTVVSAVSGGLPGQIAERQTQRASHRLSRFGLDVESSEESWTGSPGTMLGVELPTEPVPTFFFALGARGKRAEAVADEAVAQVKSFLEAQPPGIDEHSADQLLLPLALAEDPSAFRTAAISSHLLTNAAVVQQFLTRDIRCEGEQGRPGIVYIR